ncbi:MAG TPA: flavin reductase family protein, partial [Chitinophaga sp.]
RHSRVLTGNHLGQLGNVHALPHIDATFDDPHLKQIFQYYSLTPDEMETELHRYAAALLDKEQVQAAWQVLLSQ